MWSVDYSFHCISVEMAIISSLGINQEMDQLELTTTGYMQYA